MDSSETYDTDDFEQLASHCDMYDRLAATVAQPDITEDVARSTILQLVGSPMLPGIIGGDLRGNIHLAVVCDSTTNLSRYERGIMELTPVESYHMNGTNTSLAGVIGNVAGGNLSKGPLLDESVKLTLIEQFDSVRKQTQNAFQQVLDTSEYSFTKSNYRETVAARGSIFIGTNAKYGNFDQYEPLGDQLGLSPAIVAGVDFTAVNPANTAVDQDFEADALPVNLARQYIEYSRSIDPKLKRETMEEIAGYVEMFKQALDDLNDGAVTYKPGANRLLETLSRCAMAHARIRLSDETQLSDATRAIDLSKSLFGEIGIQPNVNKYNSESVSETASKFVLSDEINTKEYEDGVDPKEFLAEIIYELESEFEEGVPITNVFETAESRGMPSEMLDETLENLRHRGRVYLPTEGHLRST